MNRRTPAPIGLLLAPALALALGGCGLFHGFEIAPEDPPVRLPAIVDVERAAAEAPPAVDGVRHVRLLEGAPRTTVHRLEVTTGLGPLRNERSDLTLYVQEGGGDLLLERTWREVGPDTLIHVPIGVPFGFRHGAGERTVLLATWTPPYVTGDEVELPIARE